MGNEEEIKNLDKAQVEVILDNLLRPFNLT